MERQPHITDLPEDNRRAKIVAILIVIAMVLGGTAYFVYGTGLWQPRVQHTDQ